MSATIVAILALAALGCGWAAWNITRALRISKRLRGARVVTCPETGRPAAVTIDVRHAVGIRPRRAQVLDPSANLFAMERTGPLRRTVCRRGRSSSEQHTPHRRPGNKGSPARSAARASSARRFRSPRRVSAGRSHDGGVAGRRAGASARDDRLPRARLLGLPHRRNVAAAFRSSSPTGPGTAPEPRRPGEFPRPRRFSRARRSRRLPPKYATGSSKKTLRW